MIFVVSTFPGREVWVEALLSDISDEHHVYVIHGWELDAIAWAADNLQERFVFLQDSWRILDLARLLEDVAAFEGSLSIGDGPRVYGCYAGVYEPQVLRQVGVPIPQDKEEAITYETVWTHRYVTALPTPPPVLYPEVFEDRNGVVEEYNDRRNLVLGNDVLRKYKGTWR